MSSFAELVVSDKCRPSRCKISEFQSVNHPNYTLLGKAIGTLGGATSVYYFHPFVFSHEQNAILTIQPYTNGTLTCSPPLLKKGRISHHLNTNLLRLHVEIPINLSFLSIPLLQPHIRLLEVPTIQISLMRTQRTRMHTLQHEMSLPIHTRTPLLRWTTPSEEHYTARTLLIHNLDDSLGELLPSFSGVGVCFVGFDGEAGV
jgi:hypothetical protein